MLHIIINVNISIISAFYFNILKMKKILSPQQKEALREQIVAFSKKYIGTPYEYSAPLRDEPKTFDCSGFVQFVYGNFGYEIPRSTILQAEFIKKTITDPRKIKPGDLIYLHGKRGYYTKKYPQGIGHVAMYIGKNKVIHASGSGIKRGVKIEELESAVKNRTPLVVIKRII